MMNGTIGIDTTLLIDFFKGEEKAISFIRKNNGLLRISELVIFEFLCGNLNKKEKELFLLAIQSFPSTTFDREASVIASSLFRQTKKKGKEVGRADCMIAGSYLSSGISSIVTRNTKHFSAIKEVTVLSY